MKDPLPGKIHECFSDFATTLGFHNFLRAMYGLSNGPRLQEKNLSPIHPGWEISQDAWVVSSLLFQKQSDGAEKLHSEQDLLFRIGHMACWEMRHSIFVPSV